MGGADLRGDTDRDDAGRAFFGQAPERRLESPHRRRRRLGGGFAGRQPFPEALVGEFLPIGELLGTEPDGERHNRNPVLLDQTLR